MSRRVARWVIAVVGGLLVLLAIIAGGGSRTATLRQLVIETLSERLDSEVQLESFSVDTFPTVHVTGTNLIIRHKGRKDVPPLVSVTAFELDGGLFGLFSRPRRFRTVSLTGLQINIPPGFEKDGDSEAAPPVTATDQSDGAAAIVVDRLEARGAALTLIPKRAGKEPRVFAVHSLTMKPLGRAETMSFEATLTNPIPKGLIQTKGTFGPWHRDDPGATPLAGQYTFDKVLLSTIKGIGGNLASVGTFEGRLNRIGVKGTTHTPDFRVNVSANPVPLDTRFEAVVDGTDGDTYLNTVEGTFLGTALACRGAIVGAEGVKGRTIQLHVKIDQGRIEDVLRLGVKGDNPAMTGTLALHADMNLPAGPRDVMDRLHLAGTFQVNDARFTNAEIQKKLSDLSERARGLDPEEHATHVASNFAGKFGLANNVLNLREGAFNVPGASVRVDGTYGLGSEVLQFDGTARTKATLSQAAGGGMKSVMLKVVDPLFKRDGAGAVLPITIRGTRNDPKFGLDFGRVLKRQ
ncbi:MAG TPA: AsmA-like C-terminal region-containing protein [Vicinamibacterales bacterium]|nr:AsmA-like C-terminal region-containing protein [Vicinamibacterales bacterium]